MVQFLRSCLVKYYGNQTEKQQIRKQKAPVNSQKMNTENIKKIFRLFYDKITKRVKAVCNPFKSFRKRYSIYIRNLIDSFSETFVLIVFSIFTNFMLLLMMKIAWNSFIATSAGDHFINSYPEFASEVSVLVGKPLVMFPVELTLMVFLICMVICTLCRLSNTADYLFYTKSQIRRCLYSGLPLVIITGLYLRSRYEIENIYIVCSFTALPVFCMFSRCFHIIKRLLPKPEKLIKKVGVVLMKIKLITS